MYLFFFCGLMFAPAHILCTKKHPSFKRVLSFAQLGFGWKFRR